MALSIYLILAHIFLRAQIYQQNFNFEAEIWLEAHRF